MYFYEVYHVCLSDGNSLMQETEHVEKNQILNCHTLVERFYS